MVQFNLKTVTLIFLSVFIFFTSLHGDKLFKNEEIIKETFNKIYQEKSLENFETTEYTLKNISYTITEKQKSIIGTLSNYPSPAMGSKKYLSIKVFGKNGDVFNIKPAKELRINKYCKYIMFWISGKGYRGDLSIVFYDYDKNLHRLHVCNTNFFGWKKFKVKLKNDIIQDDEFINQSRYIEIKKLEYRPGSRRFKRKWHHFDIDDITVLVRDKYLLKNDVKW